MVTPKAMAEGSATSMAASPPQKSPARLGGKRGREGIALLSEQFFSFYNFDEPSSEDGS
jgi:hypothetical protein